MARRTLSVAQERWPRATPLRITGYVFDAVDTILVTLGEDGRTGRGEAAGVYYHGETPGSIAAQIETVRADVEAGISREALQQLLPPGGARNALDCALWDLEANLAGKPVWALAGLDPPRPLRTTFTCGADAPEDAVAKALSFPQAGAIKLKLVGDAIDAERVAAVRAALPEVWLCVDANQGFSPGSLDALMPTLVETDVKLIEQPFPIGDEALLDAMRSAIPIAADESVQRLDDLPSLVGRFDMINIKLDKCGGLTEALAMARAARTLGLEVMVGSMGGTSLAMSPAFLVGQLGEVVDLDGAALLRRDRDGGAAYAHGLIDCRGPLWGSGGSPIPAATGAAHV